MPAFAQWLSQEKQLLAHTVKAYLGDLEHFQRYLSNTYGLEQLAEADKALVRSWFVELHQNHYRPVTLHRKRAALTSFYQYLQTTSFPDLANPAANIELPKPQQRITHVTKAESILKLLNPANFPNNRKGIRDYTIMETLYGTGIRRGELINLKIRDWQEDALKIRGKGQKDRVLPLNHTLRQWLLLYLDFEQQYRVIGSDSSLFVTDKGKPLYPMYVQRAVKHYLNQYATVQQQSPHQLRHAFATHLLERGADLNAIKALLGHEQLSATAHYIHSSVHHLKTVYQQAHPKAE